MGLELFLCSKIALRVSSFITLISKLTLLYLKTSTRQNIWKSVKKLCKLGRARKLRYMLLCTICSSQSFISINYGNSYVKFVIPDIEVQSTCGDLDL